MRLICAAFAAATVLACAGPVPANAATPHQIAPGVFADPNTPAGKEYALQLQQARGAGSPPPSATSHTNSPALFGAGIPAQSAKPRTAAKRASKSTRSAPRRASRPATAPTTLNPASSAVSPPARVSATGGGGSGGTLALVGGAAVILAVGGLGGVLLRRRRLEPTSDRGIR